MEGDFYNFFFSFTQRISIHSLRMEGDHGYDTAYDAYGNFNPLPPHGGRHHEVIRIFNGDPISIHSLRMEGDLGFVLPFAQPGISIHSLRMEGDEDTYQLDP